MVIVPPADPPKEVVTVLFNGTSSNSMDVKHQNYPRSAITIGEREIATEGELISLLRKNITESESKPQENIDFIQVDGPGSGNHQVGKLFVPGKGYAYSQARGVLTGAGTTENIEHVINALDREHQACPKKIILVAGSAVVYFADGFLGTWLLESTFSTCHPCATASTLDIEVGMEGDQASSREFDFTDKNSAPLTVVEGQEAVVSPHQDPQSPVSSG